MHPNCKPDDPSIDNSESLLRRVPPHQIDGGRITDAAFDDFQCSVERESISSPQKCLAHWCRDGFNERRVQKEIDRQLSKGWKVASIVTELPRKYKQTVYPSPEVDFKGRKIKNEAHAEICGEKQDELLFQLAETAKIVLE